MAQRREQLLMHLTRSVLATLLIISQCIVRVDSWVPDVQSKLRIPYAQNSRTANSRAGERFTATFFSKEKTLSTDHSSWLVSIPCLWITVAEGGEDHRFGNAFEF
uniref:Secreted protein n=1 Tax=Anopheles maculatus TaxID=74869 RepID=A0A182S7J8_9DIPT